MTIVVDLNIANIAKLCATRTLHLVTAFSHDNSVLKMLIQPNNQVSNATYGF
jgi:hypothetical protein